MAYIPLKRKKHRRYSELQRQVEALTERVNALGNLRVVYGPKKGIQWAPDSVTIVIEDPTP